jgi:hypothetical protein
MFRSLVSIGALCVLASVKADHIQISSLVTVYLYPFAPFSLGLIKTLRVVSKQVARRTTERR